MIQWFLDRKWLPQIYIALALFLLLGFSDLAIQGAIALIPATLLCASVAFSRAVPWVATVLLGVGSVVEVALGLAPLTAGLATCATVAIVAAFGSPLIRQITVILTNALGILIAYLATVNTPSLLRPFGIELASDNSGVLAFGLLTVAIVAINTLAWVYGRLTITQWRHVGTDSDKALLVTRQAELGLEVARQTERLGIARDLTDLLVQRLSAVVSLSDGAKYLAKSDVEATERVIERISGSAVLAQSELRKLYDLLHEQNDLAAAPPSIGEIPGLVLAMRQLGYNASFSVDGEPLRVNEGAQLCVFKIVFEALENVKKNTPLETSVSVDFYWTQVGLQLLVKDNGVETARRAMAGADGMLEGYTPAEDLETLTEQIDGATLATLRERAALYSGTIEVNRVAGVGFTLSAFFPRLLEVAGE